MFRVFPMQEKALSRCQSCSWLDLEDVSCPRGVVQRVGQLARSLSMDVKERLSLVDLLAEPDFHMDTRGLVLGGSCELGKP